MDISADGRICRFLNAQIPNPPNAPMRKLMFTGVQILEPSVFDYMPAPGESKKFSTTKDVYPKMLLRRERLYGLQFDGFWQDLGTTERIQEAERILKTGQAELHYL
jgi:NDP-sugar pyrophosphorylase family protein